MSSNTKTTNSLFSQESRTLYIPQSWKRLAALLKHSIQPDGYYIIEGVFGSGKSSFCHYFQQQLLLAPELEAHYFQANPLSNSNQVSQQLELVDDKQNVIVIDDADQLSQQDLKQLLKEHQNHYFVLLTETSLQKRLAYKESQHSELPLFDKEDTYQMLSKHLSKSQHAELSQFASDTISYKAAGLPCEILAIAAKEEVNFTKEASSAQTFERANNSRVLNFAIAGALLILLIFIILKALNKPQELEVVATNGDTVAIEEDTNQLFEDDTAWLAQQLSEQFTIILLESVAHQRCQDFMAITPLADLHLLSSSDKGCRVLWRTFESKTDAESAIQTLPLQEFEQSPRVVSFSSLD